MFRQESKLKAEMEIVENTRKLTPEERRRELRLETFRQLREMEMERRARADLEELQRIREEKEERDKETETLRRQRERVEQERRMQEAKQKEEQERRANQEKAPETQKEVQLKKEKLQWEKLMMVQKEPVTRPRYTISDLKKEQQRRREEAELCPMPRVEDKASSKCLMSEVKSREQSRRKTLNNNWVGEQEKLHPNDSTCRTTAEETSLKSDTAKPISSTLLKWLRKKLRSGLRSDLKQDQMERMREASRLRELHRERGASKDGCQSRLSAQFDSYWMSRNSILKKSIF